MLQWSKYFGLYELYCFIKKIKMLVLCFLKKEKNSHYVHLFKLKFFGCNCSFDNFQQKDNSIYTLSDFIIDLI